MAIGHASKTANALLANLAPYSELGFPRNGIDVGGLFFLASASSKLQDGPIGVLGRLFRFCSLFRSPMSISRTKKRVKCHHLPLPIATDERHHRSTTPRMAASVARLKKGFVGHETIHAELGLLDMPRNDRLLALLNGLQVRLENAWQRSLLVEQKTIGEHHRRQRS